MVSKARPLKVDPTRTGWIRRRFEAEVKRRIRAFHRRLMKLIREDDAFGLKRNQREISLVNNGRHLLALVSQGYYPVVANERFAFQTNPEKVETFKSWLAEFLGEDILEPGGVDGWFSSYVEEAHRQGASRAYDDMDFASEDDASFKKFYPEGKESFLQSAFAQPVAVEKLDLLSERVFTELKGVTDTMAQQLTRGLVDGLARGDNPSVTARRMSQDIEGLTRRRALVIARTETIRAHAEGQLDALELLGVTEIGVAVEWSTAGDTFVCPLCAELEGVVFKVAEARGILPRHPNCRCAFIPANVGEDTSKQKRGAKTARKAIEESVQKERPNATREEALERSRWTGADLNPTNPGRGLFSGS
jgi:SPP1 gp7 family putative phage head morphogenesis protein